MQFYSITDRGKLRENNEDCCIAKKTGNYTLLMLADGMGGHKGGETASSCAIEAVSSFMERKLTKKLLPGQIMMFLSEALENANSKIYELSEKDNTLGGMGTTADVCVISENVAYIAHIGDSRVYKVSKDEKIVRLTKDHSLVEYMLDTGAITPEEAASHPQRNVITRALGICPEAETDILSEKLTKGDRLLLCSDGLTNMLDEKTIAHVICTEKSAEDSAKKLVQFANDAGGADNITVIITQI